MASRTIDRRPDGKYRARWYEPDGTQHFNYFRLKADAQRWLDTVAADVTAGTIREPGAR